MCLSRRNKATWHGSKCSDQFTVPVVGWFLSYSMAELINIRWHNGSIERCKYHNTFKVNVTQQVGDSLLRHIWKNKSLFIDNNKCISLHILHWNLTHLQTLFIIEFRICGLLGNVYCSTLTYFQMFFKENRKDISEASLGFRKGTIGYWLNI